MGRVLLRGPRFDAWANLTDRREFIRLLMALPALGALPEARGLLAAAPSLGASYIRPIVAKALEAYALGASIGSPDSQPLPPAWAKKLSAGVDISTLIDAVGGSDLGFSIGGRELTGANIADAGRAGLSIWQTVTAQARVVPPPENVETAPHAVAVQRALDALSKLLPELVRGNDIKGVDGVSRLLAQIATFTYSAQNGRADAASATLRTINGVLATLNIPNEIKGDINKAATTIDAVIGGVVAGATVLPPIGAILGGVIGLVGALFGGRGAAQEEYRLDRIEKSIGALSKQIQGSLFDLQGVLLDAMSQHARVVQDRLASIEAAIIAEQREIASMHGHTMLALKALAGDRVVEAREDLLERARLYNAETIDAWKRGDPTPVPTDARASMARFMSFASAGQSGFFNPARIGVPDLFDSLVEKFLPQHMAFSEFFGFQRRATGLPASMYDAGTCLKLSRGIAQAFRADERTCLGVGCGAIVGDVLLRIWNRRGPGAPKVSLADDAAQPGAPPAMLPGDLALVATTVLTLSQEVMLFDKILRPQDTETLKRHIYPNAFLSDPRFSDALLAARLRIAADLDRVACSLLDNRFFRSLWALRLSFSSALSESLESSPDHASQRITSKTMAMDVVEGVDAASGPPFGTGANLGPKGLSIVPAIEYYFEAQPTVRGSELFVRSTIGGLLRHASEELASSATLNIPAIEDAATLAVAGGVIDWVMRARLAGASATLLEEYADLSDGSLELGDLFLKVGWAARSEKGKSASEVRRRAAETLVTSMLGDSIVAINMPTSASTPDRVFSKPMPRNWAGFWGWGVGGLEHKLGDKKFVAALLAQANTPRSVLATSNRHLLEAIESFDQLSGLVSEAGYAEQLFARKPVAAQGKRQRKAITPRR